MKISLSLSDVWRWREPLTRTNYAVWAAILLAIKIPYDFMVAALLFDASWQLRYYVFPSAALGNGLGTDPLFTLGMIFFGLPFAWVGVVLTLRRLRDAGLPLLLTIAFFIPAVNLVLFFLLCGVPGQGRKPDNQSMEDAPRWRRHWPDHPLVSAVLAVFITMGLGMGGVWFSVQVLGDYGLMLFLALPFALGLIAAVIHGLTSQRSMGQCISVALLALGLLGVGLLLFAYEGAICLIMAAPIAAALVVVGAIIGYAIQWRGDRRKRVPPSLSTMALAVPLLMGMEHVGHPPASLLEVKSAIVIAAPAEVVWRQVVEFSDLPPPTDWVFRTGVAYPVRAVINGRGVGAIRRCEFTTGAFIEPIEVWDEPHLLRFGVTANPPPMEEWSPYGHLETGIDAF